MYILYSLEDGDFARSFPSLLSPLNVTFLIRMTVNIRIPVSFFGRPVKY